MATWLEFEALDVWFFRDGRPFSAGETHWVRSQFPPPPSTVLGAARAVLLQTLFAARASANADLSDYTRWLRHGDGQRPPETVQAYVEAKRRYGTGTDTGQDMHLCGPFISRANRPAADDVVPFFAAPRDLMVGTLPPRAPGRSGDREWLRLEPLAPQSAAPRPAADAKWTPANRTAEPETKPWEPWPLVAPRRDVSDLEPVGGAIEFGVLAKYLAGWSMRPSAIDLVAPETRTGIALTHSRTARQSHLYRIDFARPLPQRWRDAPAGKEAGRTRLLARVPDVPELSGTMTWWLPFGGEGRVARVCRIEPRPDTAVGRLERLLDPDGRIAGDVMEAARQSSTLWLRVLLLQPAIFRRGWLPDGVDDAGQLTVGDHCFQLRSAAVGKPQPITGWDLSTNQPKPLARAVPAGSVYYVEYVGPPADREQALTAFVQRHHGQAALQDDDHHRRAGYGLAVVGACQPVTQGQIVGEEA